jgi:hypothetical protein
MKLALTIKDLAVIKHLGVSEMAVVRGGVNANAGTYDPGFSPGYVSPATATSPVPRIDVAKMIDDMMQQNLGGYQTPKNRTFTPM